MTETVNISNTGDVSEVSMNNSNPTNEFQNIQVVYRLNGKNYLKWSQLVRTFLKERGKLSHLLETGPKEGDPKFDAWDEQDSMKSVIHASVKKTYSKVRDAAQIYEIKTKISSTKQGSRSITEYSNLLQSLWQEMDHCQCIQMKCSEDAALLKRFVEKDRIYDFLAGLNVEFDAIRVQILGKEELPSLNETIAIVRVEEGRRGVMVENSQVDSSALVTKVPTSEDNRQTERTKPINRDSVWCTYCKKARHTKERCWKLHGKPQTTNKNFSEKGGQPKGQGRANIARQLDGKNNSQESPVEFNKEEIEKLKNLLGSLEKSSSTGTCSLAFSGTEYEEDDWTC
ncbi:hypothetical protein V6Z12_A13G124300 [Gossypium hirsutum]